MAQNASTKVIMHLHLTVLPHSVNSKSKIQHLDIVSTFLQLITSNIFFDTNLRQYIVDNVSIQSSDIETQYFPPKLNMLNFNFMNSKVEISLEKTLSMFYEI